MSTLVCGPSPWSTDDLAQDPASPNAAATNKAIALELAKQIASVGGDPQDALKSGTFAPGNLDDSTGKGNSCDVADDEPGCIFSQNLLVPDATADEINAAASGAPVSANATIAGANSTTAGAGTTAAASASTGSAAKALTKKVVSNSTVASATSASGASTAGKNVQEFTGTLGGAAPPVISSASSRP